jgi:hypothetical protein
MAKTLLSEPRTETPEGVLCLWTSRATYKIKKSPSSS